jgi:hypothetical protein
MLKKITFSIYSLVIVLVLLELTLRLAGISPYQTPKIVMKVEPDFFIMPDSKLGFKQKTGKYNVFYHDSINTKLTIDTSSNRITSIKKEKHKAKQIDYYFGCSFTMGHGLSDEETFCWKIQEKLPRSKISNFAVGGTGTIYSYNQMIQLTDEEIPDRIIIVYAGFHNERNTNNLQWQMMNSLISKNKPGGIKIPYARISEDSIKTGFMTRFPEYKQIPLIENSSVVNSISLLSTKLHEMLITKSDKVTILIFDKIIDFCKKNNVKLIVLGIDNDKKTKNMLNQLTLRGIKTYDISIDLSNKEYLFLDKIHPNKIAHEKYANKIINHIY